MQGVQVIWGCALHKIPKAIRVQGVSRWILWLEVLVLWNKSYLQHVSSVSANLYLTWGQLAKYRLMYYPRLPLSVFVTAQVTMTSVGKIRTLRPGMFTRSQGCLNIKMPSYHCRNSHCKDKVILQPSYLYDSIPYTWEDGLYIEMGPGVVSV